MAFEAKIVILTDKDDNPIAPKTDVDAVYIDGTNTIREVLNEKADIEHTHTASEVEALPITGGFMEGTLAVQGIVLTEGIDYGSGDPSGGVLGQLYFKKVT